MVNTNKLKGIMVEKGIGVEDIARATNRNKATIYRKLNGKGDNFTVAEVMRIIQLLQLDNSDSIMNIFFD